MEFIQLENIVCSINKGRGQFVYIIFSSNSEFIAINIPRKLEIEILFTYIQSNLIWIKKELEKLKSRSNLEQKIVSVHFLTVKELMKSINSLNSMECNEEKSLINNLL